MGGGSLILLYACNKKRPRLMPRTVQTLIILLYHKGTYL
uniref:Uncharacterized protein n=1 Tax=Siphoviridae sp. ctzXg6 TaxID=2826531 RepID=A0A8S5NDR6_9CAUD|nr:MAG TPA: hypothetical protein [Siphoviridae sp. ctzXg6]DAY32912.1 MAG TPA: hypothetical protein [Caudoviricetes sp.]